MSPHESHRPHTLPTGTASPPCGRGSVLGDLLCDPAATVEGWLAAVQQQAPAWLPQLTHVATIAVPAAVVVVTVVVYARREARRRAATNAHWVEIQPPPGPSRAAAADFWHTITAMLNRTRRRPLTPRVLSVEIVATAETTRLGIWVPPTLSARSVIDAVTTTWPGATARVTERATLVGTRRVRAVDLTPAGGAWAPLIHPTRSGQGNRGDRGTDEPLGPLLSRLADRRGQEIACAQLLLTPHPGRHSSSRQGDSHDAVSGGQWVPLLVAVALLRALCQVLLWVLDVLLAPSHRTTNGSGGNGGRAGSADEDPVGMARRRAADAKRAATPHLHATLRVTLATPRTRHPARRRRNVVVSLASG